MSLRAEDLRTGDSLWTTTLPAVDVATVLAASDGRWRVLARRGIQFERIDGQVGTPTVTSTRWTVAKDKRTYMDIPRNDGGHAALGVAPVWEEPTLSSLLTDWRETTQLLRVDSAHTTEIATSHLRVECPAPPIDVTGYVCISFDGRSSRFWRVDLASGQLLPIGETPKTIWKPSQSSEQRLAGVANGRPVIASLDSRTLVTLIPDKYCWTQDVGVSRDVVVATCNDGTATTVSQYRYLPTRRPPPTLTDGARTRTTSCPPRTRHTAGRRACMSSARSRPIHRRSLSTAAHRSSHRAPARSPHVHR